MTGSCNDSTQPFAKTICSICYEDLKPIVEDLQVISICGHVFHELCIQQWFEYCSKGKKKCPICKQNCSASNVCRLYFQSVGDSNDPKLSQKLQAHIHDPEELRLEFSRLEGKVKGLNSALESRENDLKNISDELCVCKEQLKKEASSKNEALEQTKTITRLLNLKTEQLNKSDLERIHLQKRNMALAQELAQLKVASDLNLEEDEIVKLASLGSETNSKACVDVLKKSLVVRNQKYKELFAKFTALASEEAHSRLELEKAKEKVEKLKRRIQKIETNNEKKENEELRALKASRKTNFSPNVVEPTLIDPCTPHDTIKEPDVNYRKAKKLKGSENIYESNNNKDSASSYILIDDEDDAHVPNVSVSPEFPSSDSVPQPTKRATTDASCLEKPVSVNVHETNKHSVVPLSKYKDDDVVLVNEIGHDKPPKEAPPLPAFEKGDSCFSAGLLGPDGTKRHLGKWCKKGQSKGSIASSVPTQTSGDLIAVGADGRGGTIKILKSQNTPSLESRGSLISAKNGKFGAKTSSLQPRGCLQIDHFFGKAGQSWE